MLVGNRKVLFKKNDSQSEDHIFTYSLCSSTVKFNFWVTIYNTIYQLQTYVLIAEFRDTCAKISYKRIFQYITP